MSRRKILFCNNNLAGQLHFRGDVMSKFEQDGWEIVVVVPRMTMRKDLENLISKSWKIYMVDVNPNGFNPFQDIKFLDSLRKIYKAERPDIIFHFTIKPNIYGTLAAKLAKRKSVAMVAGLGYMFDGNSLTKRLGRLLYKFGFRNSCRVIALNRSNANRLIAGGYVRPDKMVLFKGGEGVNLTKYPYCPMRFDTTRFLMVARLLYDKGYTEYVEAAKIVKQTYPDAVIELLGPLASGSPMAVPKEVVLRDHEAGYISYLGSTTDVPSYLKRDGVIVVVVSKYLEGLNRSLMEACAMGRPIITTTNPGCMETVDEGVNGFLVPPADSKSLAQAMIRCIELSKEEKQRMSVASYAKAQAIFDVNNVISQYMKIVSDVTATSLPEQVRTETLKSGGDNSLIYVCLAIDYRRRREVQLLRQVA